MFLVTTILGVTILGVTGLRIAMLADTGARVPVTLNALRLLRYAPAGGKGRSASRAFWTGCSRVAGCVAIPTPQTGAPQILLTTRAVETLAGLDVAAAGICGVAFAGFTPKETALLHGLLERLTRNLDMPLPELVRSPDGQDGR